MFNDSVALVQCVFLTKEATMETTWKEKWAFAWRASVVVAGFLGIALMFGLSLVFALLGIKVNKLK